MFTRYDRKSVWFAAYLIVLQKWTGEVLSPQHQLAILVNTSEMSGLFVDAAFGKDECLGGRRFLSELCFKKVDGCVFRKQRTIK